MKPYFKFLLLSITLFTSCGFNASEFDNIGIKDLDTKFIALPLLDGEIDLEDLISQDDIEDLYTDSIPWYIKYKSWEKEEEKEEVKPLLIGHEVLNNDYFTIFSGLNIPLLASFQGIPLTNDIVLPINTVSPYFDINILNIDKGYFSAHFINPTSTTSTLTIDLIRFNDTDTLIARTQTTQLNPNEVTEARLDVDDITVNRNNNYTIALRLSNKTNNVNTEFQITSDDNAGIQLTSIGGIHFTPREDIDIDIPIVQQELEIDIFDNTLEEGTVELGDLTLDFITYNTFGIDILTNNIEALAISSIDSSEYSILFTSNEIDRPLIPNIERVDTLSIHKPESLLGQKPHLILLRGSLQLQFKQDIDYFIESDSHLIGQLILTIPFKLGLDNVVFTASLTGNNDFNESITFLDSAILKLEFLNYFPLNGTISVYTADSPDDPAPYRLDVNPEGNQHDFTFMESAILDDNNIIQEPTLVKAAFRITHDDAQRIMTANYLLLRGTFSTPDGRVVPFTPDQKLFVKAGIAASVKVSPNGL